MYVYSGCQLLSFLWPIFLINMVHTTQHKTMNPRWTWNNEFGCIHSANHWHLATLGWSFCKGTSGEKAKKIQKKLAKIGDPPKNGEMSRWAIIKYHLDSFIFESWQWNCRSVVMIQGQIPMRELEHTLWLISWTAQWLWVLIRYGSKWLTPKATKFAILSPSLGRTRKSIENSCHVQQEYRTRLCDAGCPTCLVPDWPQTWTMNTMMLINCSIVVSIFFYEWVFSPPTLWGSSGLSLRLNGSKYNAPWFAIVLRSHWPYIEKDPDQFGQLSLLWIQAFDCIVAHQ